MSKLEEIKKGLKEKGRRYFQFHIVTLDGGVRGMEESVDLLDKIDKTGISIDGSSVGVADVNQSDARIHPDWDTHAEYRTGGEVIDRVLCTITYKGAKHGACLRTLMKDQIARAKALGYDVDMFGELEWYFLNADGTPHDTAGYCDLPPKDKAQKIRHEIADALEHAGCLVKRIHHENGPGQNEVELKLARAMKNADDLVTSMCIISSVAAEHGLTTTFMPKPLKDDAGNGYHQHFALYDTKTGKNVFGAEWKDGVKPAMILSETGQHFTAGLLAHAEEITAVFGRDPQTFARLVPGHEAPCYACWGSSNRTALVRVPEPTDPQDTRIEYRGGDASGSTHLMCAVMLAAGLDGIEKKLPCPTEVLANADTLSDDELTRMAIRRLPRSMDECKKILQSSAWLRETLGETILNYLINGPKKH